MWCLLHLGDFTLLRSALRSCPAFKIPLEIMAVAPRPAILSIIFISHPVGAIFISGLKWVVRKESSVGSLKPAFSILA